MVDLSRFNWKFSPPNHPDCHLQGGKLLEKDAEHVCRSDVGQVDMFKYILLKTRRYLDKYVYLYSVKTLYTYYVYCIYVILCEAPNFYLPRK